MTLKWEYIAGEWHATTRGSILQLRVNGRRWQVDNAYAFSPLAQGSARNVEAAKKKAEEEARAIVVSVLTELGGSP